MPLRSLGHRAPLLWLAVPFAIGLVGGRCGLAPVNLPLTLGAATALIGLAVFAAYRARRLWPWALGLGMVCAGLASYTLHRRPLPEWAELPTREVRLEIEVERVFQQPSPERISGLAVVVGTDPHLRELAGQRLYFKLRLAQGQAVPMRSAVLEARGVWKRIPDSAPAGSFERFLADAGVNFSLNRGRVLREAREATRYRRFCARAAERLHTILGVGIAERRPELAGVLRAMLLGQQSELSEEQTRLFRQSGTMHLFAISGLHIGVIAVALHALLALLRLPVWVRLPVSLVALWFYVDVTGLAPSAVRSFLMVAWVEIALAARRPINPVATLIGAALVVLAADPLQFFTASFLMSYGIVAALILIGLPLAETWQQRWQPFALLPKNTWRWWHRLGDTAWQWGSTAVAIGLATTPVSWICGVHFFKLLTPGAFFANLVLIPASSLAILSGFVSMLVGLVGWSAGAGIFNFAAATILHGIDASVRGFVAVPGSHVAAQFRADWIGPVALGAMIAACVAGYAGGWTRRVGYWWPPVALLAGALLFGVKWG